MDIKDVKKNLNTMVVYKGKQGIYMLSACIIRKNKSNYFYQAELLDTKNNNSIVICGLDDIETEVGAVEHIHD